MATQITITKVDYPVVVTAGQSWKFEYKLYSASTWTLASASKIANATGVLSSVLDIMGLTAGQLYYVRATNNCSSPVVSYIQQIQL